MQNVEVQETQADITSATLGAPIYHSRPQATITAFLAILRRDLWVTGRELIQFLLQVLMQPLFLLFIFGKVLPSINIAGPSYGSLLLPGVVALSAVTAAMQGVSLPLTLDLGYTREIDDRLLSPLPVALVAVEKVIYAAVRGLIAGAVIFPLAKGILGSGYNVSGNHIGLLIGLLILVAIEGACLGLTLGTLVGPNQIGLMFSLVLTPMLFTGCTYYPWQSLHTIKWFQILTLVNPLTYASEGLRAAMVPAIHGVAFPHLALGWVFLGLSVTIVIFFLIGVRAFNRRVIS
jgi:ABC-2 type transport system permease protein